jgi:hypothetical protein
MNWGDSPRCWNAITPSKAHFDDNNNKMSHDCVKSSVTEEYGTVIVCPSGDSEQEPMLEPERDPRRRLPAKRVSRTYGKFNPGYQNEE